MKTALRIAIVLGLLALAGWIVARFVRFEPMTEPPIEIADEDLVEASA